MIPEIQVSKEFKSSAINSIFAILFFILVYLILVSFAIALTIGCCYAGFALITNGGHLMLLLAGAALICLGFLVLFFLIKFIFTSTKSDVSNLTLLHKDEEPILFNFIDEIVQEVGTHFPKKIYISNEVNAYVFYNSSFWSMFFPVKKNLCIGLGLVNSITVSEMRAILAHEFGHFSQKSMKVGSFVYNVNKIIYNMLYQNDTYGNALQKFSSVHGVFAIVAQIAVGIVRGMQWIMQKIYAILNKSYFGLSRQMEFHADEVAANVAGSSSLSNALLRFELAELSFTNTLNFYNEKIEDGLKSKNLFKDQQFVLGFLAKENNVPIEHSLPAININHHLQFNTSKLVIKDQWASHPSTIDRVKQLEKLNLPIRKLSNQSAWTLFSKNDTLQEEVTKHIFEEVKYENEPILLTPTDFNIKYAEFFNANNFNPIFKNFYDNRELKKIEINEKEAKNLFSSFDLIMDDALVNTNKEFKSLENDIAILNQINQSNNSIKSFDYNGIKYTYKDCNELINQLNVEKNNLEKILLEKENEIYYFFEEKAKEKQEISKFQNYFNEYEDCKKDFENSNKLRESFYKKGEFLQQTHQIDDIMEFISELKQDEYKLIYKVKEILKSNQYNSILTKSIKDNFELFTTLQLHYFYDGAYIDEELKILFNAMNNYNYIVAKFHYNLKKEILDYWASLL